MAAEAPWFERAFGEEYLRVYAHRDEAQAAREVDELARRLPGRKPRCVLDVGCGTGRHLEAWKARGTSGVGVDRSEALLRVATKRGLAVARADMRALPFAAASVDLVTLLFTTFGYFENSTEDLRVLAEAARVLTPAGFIVLDLADPAHVRAHLEPRTVRALADIEITETRSLRGERVEKKVEFRDAAGTRCWIESVRLYTEAEAKALLEFAGFRWRACEGNLDGASRTARQVHIAEWC